MEKKTPQQPSQPQTTTPDKTPPSSTLQSPVPEKKPINKSVVVLSILLILTLGTDGYFAYQNYLLKSQKVVTLPYPELPVVPTDIPNSSSEWKTYTKYVDGKYGFSFYYPNNLNITEDIELNEIVSLVLEEDSGERYTLVIGDRTNAEGRVESTITRNGIEWNIHAMVCITDVKCGVGLRAYETRKDELFITLMFRDTEDGEENPAVDRIISTFRFTGRDQ